MEIFQQPWAQLGAFGALLALGWWVLKMLRDDRKEERTRWDKERAELLGMLDIERKRNEANYDKTYNLASAVERTAAELTRAVDGLHP